MKLIAAILQESISGLFTNSIKDMDTSEYEVFKKGASMLGIEVFEITDDQVGAIGKMQYFKFTPSLRSTEYGHFAFDNVALLDLFKSKLMNSDLRRSIAKEFNISPVAKDFERQILVAANNNAVDIIRRLGYHKEVTL
jgi:hypothetical protein